MSFFGLLVFILFTTQFAYSIELNNMAEETYVKLSDKTVLIDQPYFRVIDFKSKKVLNAKPGVFTNGFSLDHNSNTILHSYFENDKYAIDSKIGLDEYDTDGNLIRSSRVPYSDYQYFKSGEHFFYTFEDYKNNTFYTALLDKNLKQLEKREFKFGYIQAIDQDKQGRVLVVNSAGFEIYLPATQGLEPVLSKSYSFDFDIEDSLPFDDGWLVYSGRAVYQISMQGEVSKYAEYSQFTNYDNKPALLKNGNLVLPDERNTLVLVGKNKSFVRTISLFEVIYMVYSDVETDGFYVQDTKFLFKFSAEGELLERHEVWPYRFIGKLSGDQFLIEENQKGLLSVGTISVPLQTTLSLDPETYAGLTLRPDGNIIAPDQSGVSLIAPDGKLVWRSNLYHMFQANAVVATDNSFVLVDREDEWHHFSKDGQILKTIDLNYQTWVTPKVRDWLISRDDKGTIEFYDPSLTLKHSCNILPNFNRVYNIYELSNELFAVTAYYTTGGSAKTNQELLVLNANCEIISSIPTPVDKYGWPLTYNLKILNNGYYYLYNYDGKFLLDKSGNLTKTFDKSIVSSHKIYLNQNSDRIFDVSSESVKIFDDFGHEVGELNFSTDDLNNLYLIYSDFNRTILYFKDGRVQFLNSKFEFVSERHWSSSIVDKPISVEDGYWFQLKEGAVLRTNMDGEVQSRTDINTTFF